MIRNTILTVAAIIIACFTIAADNFYRDYLTGFEDISDYSNPESGCIEIANNKKERIIETYEFLTKDCQFTYKIRMKASHFRKRSRLLNTSPKHSAGVVWNYIDNNNYEGLAICTENSNHYDDITNRQSLRIDIFKVTNGKETALQSFRLNEEGVNDTGYHTVKISYDGDSLTISAGHRQLENAGKIGYRVHNDNMHIGYFAGRKSKLTVKRIEYATKPIKMRQYSTAYTKEKLDSLFAASNDPNEGYWKYLDRKMDDKKMRLGGKYTLAIVKSPDGYQILYADGASTMPDIWKPYMTKGIMKATPFIGTFDLQWIDSEKEIIPDEGYATFEEGILTINLPINGTSVRFYKL